MLTKVGRDNRGIITLFTLLGFVLDETFCHQELLCSDDLPRGGSYLHVLRDEVDGHGVLGAPGDDHVRVLLGGQAELLEGRLHQARVLWTDIYHLLIFRKCA